MEQDLILNLILIHLADDLLPDETIPFMWSTVESLPEFCMNWNREVSSSPYDGLSIIADLCLSEVVKTILFAVMDSTTNHFSKLKLVIIWNMRFKSSLNLLPWCYWKFNSNWFENSRFHNIKTVNLSTARFKVFIKTFVS